MTPAEMAPPGPRKCARCGEAFPRNELRRTSMPSLTAMAVGTDWEPWDAEPPPILLDREWCCPDCVHRTNMRRIAVAITILIASAVTVLIWRF